MAVVLLIPGNLWSQSEAHAIRQPYPPVRGSYAGVAVEESPDPLVGFRWEHPQSTDDLEIYTLGPETMEADRPENVAVENASTVRVTGSCNLRFDFGRVSAAWFEFDSQDLEGDVEMSISEFNEPAVVNAGAQHPRKTAKPVRYGNTWRLELNTELYEGVRFAWIHIHSLAKPADLSSIRLVCQVKPANYEGSFSCSDPMLTKIWYTGAYTVKLNLLREYYGAILMERSDRHSWTGDAYPAQAASLVAFGNEDFVKANLRYTSTQFNGIPSYSLYWVLSLLDYYDYTGDEALLEEMRANACEKLDLAYHHYGTHPPLVFYGWDERLGAGFENASCPESQLAYQMLSIRAWNQFSTAMNQSGHPDLAARYRQYAAEKVERLRKEPSWTSAMGIHAAADAINAGFPHAEEHRNLWATAFADRLQRVSYSPFNQYFILQSMARLQRHSEALNTIDDCWGGQIRYGGTTFFEIFRPSWNDISRPNDAPINAQCGYTSMTHPWSSGVTKWLSEEILGVKPMSPGFAEFSIKPHLSANVKWVKGSVPTPHGTIRAHFDAETGHGSLSVPPKTRAELGIPKAGRTVQGVDFGGREFAKSGEDANFVYYSGLPEGEYRLNVRYHGPLHQPDAEPFRYHSRAFAEDPSTQGNWKGRYGGKGHVLFNYHESGKALASLPPFVRRMDLQKNNHTLWARDTTEARALEPVQTGEKRNVGAIYTRDPIPCDQTMTIDVDSSKGSSCKISLYFLDWDRQSRRLAMEVFDLEDKKLLMPVYMVRDFENGKYVTFPVDRPVRIRINQVRGPNAVVSGIFFD